MAFKTSEGRDPRHGTKKGWDALSADASALSLGTGLWDLPYPKKESRISRIAALAVIPPALLPVLPETFCEDLGDLRRQHRHLAYAGFAGAVLGLPDPPAVDADRR